MTNDKKPEPPKPEKYDPQREYYARMNEPQRALLRARRNHQFSYDVGGCDANYRKGS